MTPGGGYPTANQAALAIIRASRILNIDPLIVFEPRVPFARSARQLAAAGLVKAMLASPGGARDAMQLFSQDLAPSAMVTKKISPAMVEQVAGVLNRAFPNACAEPARPFSPGFGGPCGRFAGPLPEAASVPAMPARRASVTVGKPKPGGKQPDLIAEPGLFEAVTRLRAKHTPWPHIAMQLRKPVISLRRAFDPEFVEG